MTGERGACEEGEDYFGVCLASGEVRAHMCPSLGCHNTTLPALAPVSNTAVSSRTWGGASPGTQTQHTSLGVLHELVC